jgi:hypothetical protein
LVCGVGELGVLDRELNVVLGEGMFCSFLCGTDRVCKIRQEYIVLPH